MTTTARTRHAPTTPVPALDDHDLGTDWHDDLMIVCDGGACFFTVEFDPTVGTYQNLIINGEA